MGKLGTASYVPFPTSFQEIFSLRKTAGMEGELAPLIFKGKSLVTRVVPF